MSSSSVTPVFIFGLPRSGSTLLQRIVSAHVQVHSLSETWLNLPLAHMLQSEGVVARYGHQTCYSAILEFAERLPKGQTSVAQAFGTAVCDLYAAASPHDITHVVDKTPRYHWCLDYCHKAFPQGKFIYLFRPIEQIFSSILETWNGGSLWNLNRFWDDIFQGYRSIAHSYDSHREESLAIQFSDVVEVPALVRSVVAEYLGLSNDGFPQDMLGQTEVGTSMGDPVGTKLYTDVSSEPLEKWYTFLDTPVKWGVLRYLVDHIPESAFAIQAHSPPRRIKQYSQLPFLTYLWRTLGDSVSLVWAYLKYRLHLNIWFGKQLRKWIRTTYIS